MMKTALIASAVIFTAPAAGPLTEIDSATAEQTILPLADTEAVIAQFSYLEICHDGTGFNVAVTDTTAVFVDLEFPGDLHIRIGF